jgi:hypothetical protein
VFVGEGGVVCGVVSGVYAAMLCCESRSSGVEWTASCL